MMGVGDFEEIYGVEEEDNGNEPHVGQWDAVLTCFFIDTVSDAPPTRDTTREIPTTIGKEYCQLPAHHT